MQLQHLPVLLNVPSRASVHLQPSATNSCDTSRACHTIKVKVEHRQGTTAHPAASTHLHPLIKRPTRTRHKMAQRQMLPHCHLSLRICLPMSTCRTPLSTVLAPLLCTDLVRVQVIRFRIPMLRSNTTSADRFRPPSRAVSLSDHCVKHIWTAYHAVIGSCLLVIDAAAFEWTVSRT